MKTFKQGSEVKTKGNQLGVVKYVDGELALVWFYGHQRNSSWFNVNELKGRS